MAPIAPAGLHVLGYVTSSALYLALLVILWQSWPTEGRRLPLATAILGLVWNLGNLLVMFLSGIEAPSAPFVEAAAIAALGCLPAVVVHSVSRRCRARFDRMTRALTTAAYLVSGLAAAAHFRNAWVLGFAPSPAAMHIMTPAFGAIILPLAYVTRGEPGWRRALWVAALALFSLSGTHLAHHSARDSVALELVGDHASLLLAMAILYQDYRFALADLFLSRALTILAMVAVVVGVYPLALAALVALSIDPSAVPPAAGLAAAVVAALIYPGLLRVFAWSVDRLVLHREPHERLRLEIARLVEASERPDQVLDSVCRRLAEVFAARSAHWRVADAATPAAGGPRHGGPVQLGRAGAVVDILTADLPRFEVTIEVVSGGRRLTTDDGVFLERVAVLAAQRIDALRLSEERFAQQLREQEIRTLAVEAELKALQAQLNPHFLFNALNTVGHLIQSAPSRALDTLLDLTDLLRAVLHTDGKFTTLGREMEVILSYLEIERARFEERLTVRIDVPSALHGLSIPPLIVLPLVENAIKHGIGRAIGGGTVTVRAGVERGEAEDATPGLRLTVIDTGADRPVTASENRGHGGVGLVNLERRLRAYYGDHASLTIARRETGETEVDVRVPIDRAEAAGAATGGAESAGLGTRAFG